MKKRVELQSSYVLHARHYRETSLLLECWTIDYGRVSVVARGVRQARSRWRGVLQPFVPLFMNWIGNTELYTLTHVEATNAGHALLGDKLVCGLYVNELLLRLLHREDPHPNLFEDYQHLLQQLRLETSAQAALRIFEKRLIHALGYAFSLRNDYKTGEKIIADAYYQFDVPQGLTRTTVDKTGTFMGKNLLAFANEKLTDSIALKETKRLMRMALAVLLGEKPLKSRELFI